MHESPNPHYGRNVALVMLGILLALVLVVAFSVLLDSGDANQSSRTGPPAPRRGSEPAAITKGGTYEQSLDAILADYAAAVESIKKLYTSAAEDASLISDATWRSRAQSAASSIRSANSKIEALSPPAAYSPAHEDYLLMAASYDAAVYFLERGIENLDGADMMRATNSIVEAAEYKHDADGEMP